MNRFFKSIAIIISLAFLNVNIVLAQYYTSISGHVEDLKTKESLYPATIKFHGVEGGILTDENGNFNISMQGNLESFSCSYLGYETQVFKVKKGKNNTYKIKLKASSNQLAIATVEAKKGKMPKDTFAIRLWRNIVENKEKNAALVSDYLQYKNYEKVQINIDQFHKIAKFRPFRKTLNFMLKYVVEEEYNKYLPTILSEKASDIYWQKNPNKEQKVTYIGQVLGIPISDIGEIIHEEVDKFDIYSNSTKIMQKSIILPFSSTSNTIYKYFVTDSLVKDSIKFYYLEFMGKTPEELAFAGGAWVEDVTFAIHELNMNIPRTANVNFISNYKIEQKFTRLEDGTFLREIEKGQRSISLFKPKNREPFGISMHNTNYNYKAVYPDSIDNAIFSKNNVTFKKDYFNTEFEDSKILAEERPLPLHEQESKINLMMMELMMNIMNKKNGFNTLYKIGKTAYTSYIPFKHFDIGALHEIISYNSVEGTRFKLGIRSNSILKNKLKLYAYAAYGTKDKLIKGKSSIAWTINKNSKNTATLSASYSYDYMFPTSFEQRNYQNIFYSFFVQNANLLNKKIPAYPLEKLLKVRNINLSYNQIWTEGLSSTLTLSNKVFYGDEYTGFSFFNEEGSMAKLNVNQAHLSLYFGAKKVWYNIFLPDDNSIWKKHFPSINFDYTFNHIMDFDNRELFSHKFDIRLKYTLQSLLGSSTINMHLSKSIGDIAYPLMTLHAGNESNFIRKNTYNAMQNAEFVSDESIGFLLEQRFNGFILNKLPLIRKLKYREVFFFRGLWGNIRENNLSIMQLPTDMYIPKNYQEIGFGIENIFKFIRVDFIWRLRHLENLKAKKFNIKIGAYINF